MMERKQYLRIGHYSPAGSLAGGTYAMRISLFFTLVNDQHTSPTALRLMLLPNPPASLCLACALRLCVRDTPLLGAERRGSSWDAWEEYV